MVKSARISLALGAAVLLATALFHGSGGAMVSGWLAGPRGEMLRALWYLPSLDWFVVALVWAFAAARPSQPIAPLILITALIPLGAVILVASAVGIGFPGVWMLTGASLLAGFGAVQLRRMGGAAHTS